MPSPLVGKEYLCVTASIPEGNYLARLRVRNRMCALGHANALGSLNGATPLVEADGSGLAFDMYVVCHWLSLLNDASDT